ncbi:MAG: nucleotidyltransferase [Candidatus Marinimicrobia bacterium]|nr:nucleotidyltransferase [Candidatus Neomarinimicrobiota bacterium]
MLNQDYKEMLSTLLEEKVNFLIVGAYAMAAHGYPRATGDIDIFIQPNETNAEKVYNALIKFGAPLKNVSTEDFSTPGMIFQIGVTPRRIVIINSIDGVSFEDAYSDRIIVEIESLPVPVISKENIIKNKEATGRPRDKLDADNLKNS